MSPSSWVLSTRMPGALSGLASTQPAGRRRKAGREEGREAETYILSICSLSYDGDDD